MGLTFISIINLNTIIKHQLKNSTSLSTLYRFIKFEFQLRWRIFYIFKC